MFKVGDKVKIKSSVTRPLYGWGVAPSKVASFKKATGTILSISGDTIEVQFSKEFEPFYNDLSWLAHKSELIKSRKEK